MVGLAVFDVSGRNASDLLVVFEHVKPSTVTKPDQPLVLLYSIGKLANAAPH
jgi:hypothetical protein